MSQQTHHHQITYPTLQNQDPSYITWLEIDTAALDHNVSAYKAICKPALLAPVIKSNAYGHGIEIVAHFFDQHNAVDILCVVSLSEAIYLRTIGIKKRILVLSIIDRNVEHALVYDIDIIVYDLFTVQELNRLGKLHHKKAHVHVKIDTGLSRLGLLQHQAIAFIESIHQLPFITINGIFTHYAFSESADQTYTNYQLNNFNTVIDYLENKNIHIPLRHTSCSAALTANIGTHHTMVRTGIGMYGLWPSNDNKTITQQQYPHFSLRPALTWKTRVIQVKEIPAGSYIGYNLTHQVQKTSQIATLPIGYWDGYDRRLANKGMVYINGKIVAVVGIVAMNLTMIDVTGLHVAIGDEVTVLGNHPGLTADDIAQKCGTINYEIVTRINPLLHRLKN